MNPRSFPEKTLLGEEHKNWNRQESGSEPGTLCVFLRVFSSMSLCERQYIALTKIDGICDKGQAIFHLQKSSFWLSFWPKIIQNSLNYKEFSFYKHTEKSCFQVICFRTQKSSLTSYHVCKSRFTSNSKPQQHSSLPSFIVCSALASTIQLENLSQ